MSAAMAPLFGLDHWPVFVLLTGRVTGLMLTAPLWSMTAMPRAVRAAITLVLALVLTPAAPAVALPGEALALPAPFATELAIGALVGLAAAVVVHGAALAGEVVSLQMGLSLGPALSPAADVPVAGVAQLQSMLALLLFTSIGGHLAVLQVLADSLRALPPGGALDAAGGVEVAEALLGSLLRCAVCLAAPVMATMLLVNVAMALLSRAVPQLNAMMVSLPITIAAGLLATGLTLPGVALSLQRAFAGAPDLATHLLGAITARTGP